MVERGKYALHDVYGGGAGLRAYGVLRDFVKKCWLMKGCWKFLIVVFVLSACEAGEPTSIAGFEIWPKSKAEVNQNLGVRVELLEGPAVPMARLLAEEVSDRLEKSRVPATIDPTRPSRYILKGRTELNLLGKSDEDYIYIKWELQDNVGQVLGSHTQGVKATRTQWEFGDPRIIRSVGNGALGPILAMLPNAPKKKPTPARAPITTAMVVKPVIGAPGDGNVALTNAIEAALRAVDIFITKDPRQAAYALQGHVDVGLPVQGKEPVKIIWTVSTASGALLGRATQENFVPSRSLNAAWGHVANLVAAAAVDGIEQVLDGSRGGRVTSQEIYTPPPPPADLPQIPGRALPPE
ncbi:MAG: hypothetical protein HN578_10825 [Rhodospirillales bacterium]|nr:hypothetical protein [Rhodospirillales bacterium]